MQFARLNLALCTKRVMDNYLESCRKLSLTARMAIALLVFERFCAESKIHHSLFSELSDYLWKWPLIDGPDQFEPWESARPELVNYALGDEASRELVAALDKAQIEESRFRKITEGLVEILWGSFWGASEDELSMKALETVIASSKVEKLPSLTPFKFSLFSDMSGWGEKLTVEDRNYWRTSYKSA